MLPLFFCPATAARTLGGFASSCEAKDASTSEAPSPSHSERAASAFNYYLIKSPTNFGNTNAALCSSFV
ncbi:hypothetical protein CN679_17190 [Bacillus pseudomycoides]|nr:hypothetical protein COO02_22655 [Bacillus pseudomycoides]PEI90486.1 hypothetical protein CN679_17190 [Bacillus pseudomycoides]PHF49565.1 hypothetical protein COF72_07285 [Bacillus pseudomycoides]